MVGEFASHGREAAPSTKTPMPSEDLGGGGGMRPSARWGAVIKRLRRHNKAFGLCLVDDRKFLKHSKARMIDSVF